MRFQFTQNDADLLIHLHCFQIVFYNFNSFFCDLSQFSCNSPIFPQLFANKRNFKTEKNQPYFLVSSKQSYSITIICAFRRENVILTFKLVLGTCGKQKKLFSTSSLRISSFFESKPFESSVFTRFVLSIRVGYSQHKGLTEIYVFCVLFNPN